ncbi:hypothetical protein Ndes2526B_g02438 [Nannochloris sp. 'desiccata']
MMNLCSQTPVFATSKIGGPVHMPIYESIVTIMGWQMGISKMIPTVAGQGQGNSKKQAEHEAAVEALLELKKVDGLAWPNLFLTPKSRSYPAFQPMPQPGQQNAFMLIEAAHVGGNRTADYYANRVAHTTDVY